MLSPRFGLFFVLALWCWPTNATPPSCMLEAKKYIDPLKTLVIMDNDWSGAFGFLPAIIALASDNVEVLGLTTVTGNAWNAQQNRHCLRLLEIAGRTDIPVAAGGLYPLINTQDRFQLWQNLYGNLTFSGAYGEDYGYPYDPTGGDPYAIRDLPEGNPSPDSSISNLTAAEFMIQQVKAYPGRVILYCAGPFTNIAIAMREFPAFASMTAGIILDGVNVDVTVDSLEGHSGRDLYSNFNVIFDPEAASAVLRGNWTNVTVYGRVTSQTTISQAILNYAKKSGGLFGRVYSKYAVLGQAYWDETPIAALVNPKIITKSVVARMDAETSFSASYGRTLVWGTSRGPSNLRNSTIITSINSTLLISVIEKTFDFFAGRN